MTNNVKGENEKKNALIYALIKKKYMDVQNYILNVSEELLGPRNQICIARIFLPVNFTRVF